MPEQPVFDVVPRLPRIDVAASSTAAKKTFGKGFGSQLKDLFSLTRGAGKLTAEEYFYFGLFDDSKHTLAQKRMFAGRKLEQQLHHLTCEVEWFGAVHDKLICYRVLESFGFPIPRCLAVYRRGADLGNIVSLGDAAAVARYLRSQECLPFVGKPVTGIRSAGVAACDSYDSAADELIMAGGERIAVESFVGALDRYSLEGYLFQARVSPHRTVRQVCGDRLATARVIVLIDEDGPHVHLTLWKIPVGENVADNFWRDGNLLAWVEPETGEVLRVVTGVGLQCREVSAHPDTGIDLLGYQLPDWQDVRGLCVKAARVFPNLRMQAFDVALSDDGPVIMEINVGGDYSLPQLASGQGMLTPRFRKFLEGCAKARDLSGILKQLRLDDEGSQ